MISKCEVCGKKGKSFLKIMFPIDLGNGKYHPDEVYYTPCSLSCLIPILQHEATFRLKNAKNISFFIDKEEIDLIKFLDFPEKCICEKCKNIKK